MRPRIAADAGQALGLVAGPDGLAVLEVPRRRARSPRSRQLLGGRQRPARDRGGAGRARRPAEIDSARLGVRARALGREARRGARRAGACPRRIPRRPAPAAARRRHAATRGPACTRGESPTPARGRGRPRRARRSPGRGAPPAPPSRAPLRRLRRRVRRLRARLPRRRRPPARRLRLRPSLLDPRRRPSVAPTAQLFDALLEGIDDTAIDLEDLAAAPQEPPAARALAPRSAPPPASLAGHPRAVGWRGRAGRLACRWTQPGRGRGGARCRARRQARMPTTVGAVAAQVARGPLRPRAPDPRRRAARPRSIPSRSGAPRRTRVRVAAALATVPAARQRRRRGARSRRCSARSTRCSRRRRACARRRRPSCRPPSRRSGTRLVKEAIDFSEAAQRIGPAKPLGVPAVPAASARAGQTRVLSVSAGQRGGAPRPDCAVGPPRGALLAGGGFHALPLRRATSEALCDGQPTIPGHPAGCCWPSAGRAPCSRSCRSGGACRPRRGRAVQGGAGSEGARGRGARAAASLRVRQTPRPEAGERQ